MALARTSLYSAGTMKAMIGATFVVLLEVLSFGAVLPVIGEYCQTLGADADQVGLWTGILFFLQILPKVFTNPFWGRLSDRLGRKPIVLVVTLGTMSGSIVWALSTGLGMLIVSRAITGIFSAQATLAQTIAADSTPPEKRAASMGMLGAAFGIGVTVGPLLGGILGEQYSEAAVGWLCCGFQLTSLLIVMFMLPETREKQVATGSDDKVRQNSIGTLIGDSSVMWVLMTCLVMTVGIAMLNFTIMHVTLDWYGMNKQSTGYLLAVMGLIGTFVQGGMIRPMVKRSGEIVTTGLGLVLTAAGLFLLGTQPESGGLWTAISLIAIGSAFAVPALTGLLSRRVPADIQGVALGLNQSFTASGRAVGALAGGWIYSSVGQSYPYSIGGVLVLASIALLIAARREPAAVD